MIISHQVNKQNPMMNSQQLLGKEEAYIVRIHICLLV